MRLSPILLTALIVTLAVAANGESQRTRAQLEAEWAEARKFEKIWERALELQPQRRDAPLRYLNISDNEVREIQVLSEKYIPKVLLNIGPVVTGCACEEGPQCTDQVYIVAENSQNTVALQLSRVRNVWQVGVVQQWWLKYSAIRPTLDKLPWAKFQSARSELLREFPACIGELVPAENTIASAPKAEAKK